MNDIVNKIKKAVKNPKVLIVFGLGGILLIAFSSFFTSKSGEGVEQNGLSADKYRETITDEIEKIVTKISGDKSPTVVVTLESGPRYTYADSRENDNATASGDTNTQSSEKSRRSYVTVRDSDGSERALIIAENMPEIRGVAVICGGGSNEYIAEKIKNAVTAALNITSKRVYVSGGTE